VSVHVHQGSKEGRGRGKVKKGTGKIKATATTVGGKVIRERGGSTQVIGQGQLAIPQTDSSLKCTRLTSGPPSSFCLLLWTIPRCHIHTIAQLVARTGSSCGLRVSRETLVKVTCEYQTGVEIQTSLTEMTNMDTGGPWRSFRSREARTVKEGEVVIICARGCPPLTSGQAKRRGRNVLFKVIWQCTGVQSDEKKTGCSSKGFP